VDAIEALILVGRAHSPAHYHLVWQILVSQYEYVVTILLKLSHRRFGNLSLISADFLAQNDRGAVSF